MQHEKIIETLSIHRLGKEYLQLIRNLYWNQKAAVRLSNEITKYKEK